MQNTLIVGSGLVGAAMAIALAKSGIAVDMIEAKSQTSLLDTGYDGRTSAIAHISVQILRSIGVWQRINTSETCPITDIRVCEQGGRFFVHYDSRDAGHEPFGYIVENRLLRKALYEAVADEANIHLRYETILGDFSASAGQINATLNNGGQIAAPLMLVADGKYSKTRDKIGIKPSISDYQQTAIVATIAHSNPHHGLALEAFYPSGPFAVLPMTGGRSNIVWTEPNAMAAHLMALSEAEFLQEIKRRDVGYLGDITLVGPRHAYPLQLIRAERLVDERIALIGDAGHGIHPIAGQGVNLGYRDVAVLAEMLIGQARLGLDLGDSALLARYASRRRSDIHSMSMATDLLNRLFSNHIRPLRAVRDMGLGAVNRLTPVKRRLMQHAMGITGDMPPMMRGEPMA